MDGFDWDDANLSHIAEHDVTAEEVEEIICGDAFELDAQYEDGEERFPLIGETARGRILFVIYTERDGLMRPVTAYQPGAFLRNLYLQWMGAR